MRDVHWNPWHGCNRVSEGCLNCYMFDMDRKFGRKSTLVYKTKDFDLPIRKSNKNESGYYIESKDLNGGFVFTGMSSDFFHEKSDCWRLKAYEMIKERSDLNFMIFTKRINRFNEVLPDDWGDGYENVFIGLSCENQNRLDERASILVDLPVKHKTLILAPMLENMNLEKYLKTGEIECVSIGGEKCEINEMNKARMLDYNWVLNVRDQCIKYDVNFIFQQIGSCFVKDGHIFRVKGLIQQRQQAEKANINYLSKIY